MLGLGAHPGTKQADMLCIMSRMQLLYMRMDSSTAWQPSRKRAQTTPHRYAKSFKRRICQSGGLYLFISTRADLVL